MPVGADCHAASSHRSKAVRMAQAVLPDQHQTPSI